MEGLKQMSLKKAFFFLTLLFLLIALILSVVSILGISELLKPYGFSLELTLGNNNLIANSVTEIEKKLPLWYHIIKILQFVLPILLVVVGLLSADLVFYRIKLKKPLAELQVGAGRIMQNDLDFSIQTYSKDELGELCNAFEAMRRELLKSNKELWKQMEERKRLNAAFSHDLRNPITVLKGSAKMLRNGLFNGELSQENAKEALSLIEEYVVRIETYVEAMSSVQRLEELQSSPKNLNWETLAKELSKSIQLLTINSGIEVKMQFEKHEQLVLVDKAILFNVAENLIVNALRYAKRQVDICLKIEKAEILLSIKDDGCGFTSTILKKGAQPFLRGGENNEQKLHFGMGLYVCRLLCEKHGGSLKIENISEGALVTANFNISKP